MKPGYFGLLVLLAIGLFTPQYTMATEIRPAGNTIENTSDTIHPALELYGYLKGEMKTVAVSGNYAFINIDERLVVMDISDKSHPHPVAQTERFTGMAEDIFIMGNYAYAAAGYTGMYIFNISNPLSPAKMSFFPAPDNSWNAKKLTVISTGGKDYAFVAAGNYGMRVIEVTDPYAPVEIGSYKLTGSAYDVTVAGNHAYVAYSFNGLHILDITTPATPTWVGTYTATNYYILGIIVDGNYAYTAGYDNSMDWTLRVVNISNPASPSETGTTTSSDLEIFDMAKSGNTIYLAQYYLTSGAYMSTVNVASPSSPSYSYSYWIRGGEAHRLALGLPYVYVSGAMNFNVINTSATPYTLHGVYGTPMEAHAVAVAANTVYIGNGWQGLISVDVTDRSNPYQIGYAQVSGYPKSIDISKNYAYVGDDYGFFIYDISDPTDMVQTGNRGGGIREVEVRGRYLYAATEYALAISDIYTPTSPAWIGYWGGATAWNSGVALHENYAYLADSVAGMKVIDITDPYSPVPSGSLTPEGSIYFTDVAVDYPYAYFTDWYAHLLRIVQVSDPAHPVQTGTYPLVSDPSTVVANRNRFLGADKRFAFTAEKNYGLYLLDVSNVYSPTLMAHTTTRNQAWNMAVQGNYVYVADLNAGLSIYRISRDVVTGTIPTTGGALTSHDLDTQITVPNGTFTDTVEITYRQLWTDENTGEREGLGQTFEISAVYTSNDQPAQMQPGKSISIAIAYASTGPIIENTLELYGWNSSTQKWDNTGVASSNVNTSGNIVNAQINQLSLFAVLGDTNRGYLPIILKND